MNTPCIGVKDVVVVVVDFLGICVFVCFLGVSLFKGKKKAEEKIAEIHKLKKGRGKEKTVAIMM